MVTQEPIISPKQGKKVKLPKIERDKTLANNIDILKELKTFKSQKNMSLNQMKSPNGTRSVSPEKNLRKTRKSKASK